MLGAVLPTLTKIFITSASKYLIKFIKTLKRYEYNNFWLIKVQ